MAKVKLTPIRPGDIEPGMTIRHSYIDGDFAMVIRGVVKDVRHFDDESEILFSNGDYYSFTEHTSGNDSLERIEPVDD